jgi:hypothetical protein
LRALAADDRRRALAAARSKRNYMRDKLGQATMHPVVDLNRLRDTLRAADWLKPGEPDDVPALDRLIERVIARWCGYDASELER